MFGPRPDAPDLRGHLYKRGFAPQYAVRAQALSQLLVAVWLLPTASQADKAMLTEMTSSAISVCQKQITQGSAVSPSYEIQQPSAP